MRIKELTKVFARKAVDIYSPKMLETGPFPYRPTPYLSHPFLQSIYNISQPLFPYKFKRQKIFFEDGGHISLDWSTKTTETENPPVLFVMHGLTGGSEMNYIKALVNQAENQGYCCVCLNSRGINNEMTSPIPFTAIQHGQLEAAFERVSAHYPNSPIYIVGTSFGGNYLMRYLIRKNVRNNIKGFVALAPPIDVRGVVDDMGSVYQKFFVKRYIEETVTKHPHMQFWADIGLVDMADVKKSQNLREFHGRITAKILGFSSVDEIFDAYTIADSEIQYLKVKTLIMLSKDDPIVSYKSMPFSHLEKNKNIKMISTEKGGHLCWFEGIIPKRWYPRPVLDFLKQIRDDKKL